MKTMLLATALVLSTISGAQASGYDCSKGVRVLTQKPPMFQVGDQTFGFMLSKKVNKEIQAIAQEMVEERGLTLSESDDAMTILLYVNPKSGYVGIPMRSGRSGQQQYQERGIMAGSYQESTREGLDYALNKCLI